MFLRTIFSLSLSLLVWQNAAIAAPSPFTVKPDHVTGVYTPGEKITWTVDVTGDRTAMTALPYTVRKDGKDPVASGTLDLSKGPATLSASREEPGALFVEIMSMDKTKPLPIGMGGAVVSPEKIVAAKPAPEDFDTFWQAKLKELAAVPPQPVVEKLDTQGLKNSEGVELDKVTLNNIRDTHVRALFAKPVADGKYPALMIVNSAGVYALDKNNVIAQAKPGWLVLNVNAHDLPVDEPDEFYKNLKETTLKNYIGMGNEDRETCYFLRMLLGCVRGAEYLASRPDWDGKTLVVTGVSQGGLQSFATAGLYPKITLAMIDVPAGCDVYGPLGNPPRGISWPYWLATWSQQGKDTAKIQQTAGYFDSIYFAARMKCPALVGVALADVAARPAGVISAYNAITTPKKLLIMPLSDHYGSGGAQNDYFNTYSKWKDLIKKGQPLPL